MQFKPQEVWKKNALLTREDLERQGEIIVNGYEESEALGFLRIRGVSNFWEANPEHFDSLLADVLNGLAKYGTIAVYCLISRRSELVLYLGSNHAKLDLLHASLLASYPGIQTEIVMQSSVQKELSPLCTYGGVVVGTPTNKAEAGHAPQIESLCRGMFGSEWAYVWVAKAMSPFQVYLTHDRLLEELNEVSQYAKRSFSGGELGNETREITDFKIQRYLENVGALEEKMLAGRSRGAWRAGGYYAAPDPGVADKIANQLKSIYTGEDSKPDPVRTVPLRHCGRIIPSFGLLNIAVEEAAMHPAGMWTHNGQQVACFNYKCQNVLTSDELATFLQIPRQEMPGYFIDQHVQFDVAERKGGGNFKLGNIIYDNRVLPNCYKLDVKDLDRHGLIIGMTGGGKTNTSKSLLRSLWKEHGIPFLVIESAKTEYWELANLKGFEDMLLFTLGSETKHSIPYRINPFEVPEHVSLQTHIDYLMSTFKASFELFPPMPFVLETSVYEVYQDRGWDVLRNVNILGRLDFPTLEDLYYKIDVVVERFGYDKRLQSDIQAALKARIHSLRVGGKGAMLDTQHSVPISQLLSKPVVMELEDIGDDDVKAFIIGIVLVQLYEYRKSKMGEGKKSFEHLILIEEAHRLLKNVPQGGEGANPRANSVEFFTNLLAEIRSYGQGILIADQVPTKLAPDTLKNTNLKIVHRIVMQEDREIIGQSMNMTQEQIQFLSNLKRGQAAVYAEGDTRPKLVKMPLVESDYTRNRSEVLHELKVRAGQQFATNAINPRIGPACSFCQEICEHKQVIDKWLVDGALSDELLHDFGEQLAENFTLNRVGLGFRAIEENHVKGLLSPAVRLCLFNKLLEQSKSSESQKREWILSFLHGEGRRKQ